MKTLADALKVAIFLVVCAAAAHAADNSEKKTTKSSATRVEKDLHEMTTKDWDVEVITKDINYPWAIKESGGRLIMTEAAGNIVMIANGRLVRLSLKTSDKIVSEGGGGLLGMALSDDFEKSGIAYFYHSYRSAAGLTNKVIQARFDGKSWAETKTLLAGIPGHPLYNGGRVAMGPDKLLYVTTGWTKNNERPQDLKNLAGKVLRMTTEGKVPSDNPFKGSYVYSYGHRNPQGIAWSEQGELFVVEHGEWAHDEINLVKPGANYGWPLISGDEKKNGMEVAWFHTGDQTWAPSGVAFSKNNLLVAALAARGLYAVDKNTKDQKLIFSSGERLRDVLPSGSDIYIITTNRSPRSEGKSEDRLLKLTAKK